MTSTSRTSGTTTSAHFGRGSFVSLNDLFSARPEARLALLESTAEGLSSAEAESRFQRIGPNEPARPPRSSLLQKFVLQFTHTLALLLWFAAGLAFATGLVELGGAIVAVVGINGLFAFVQEYRAEQVVESLMRRVAIHSRTRRDGAVQLIEARLLVPGDIVYLSAGDIAPADCVLLESTNLTCDLSMLTGESYPVSRDAAPGQQQSAAYEMHDVPCALPAGSGIVTGTATAIVWATGPNSSVGAIAQMIESAGGGASSLDRQVEGLSKATAVIAVMAGAITLGLASLVEQTPFASALTFGTGVIVALVPEGLLPTLSVALAIGAQRIARRGAAVRQLSAVEVIGSVTVICSDKTGTLTENSLTVERFVGPGGSAAPDADALLAAVLCNEASLDGDDVGGDPLDAALWRWAAALGAQPEALRQSHPRLSLVPFDARRRLTSVTCSVEGTDCTYVKGAPEAVLPLTTASVLPDALLAAAELATGNGERVLLLAGGPAGLPLRILGLAGFRDQPRVGVPDAISACRTAGIRVVMLTGDHPNTAAAIARTIGLVDDNAVVILGDAIDSMSDREISEHLSANSVVARVNPEQKLRIVRALKASGEIVVVTGDGINDAPALEASDVGVAMGLKGTEVAKQAGDIVLADDHFATIVAAIEEGRSIKTNIRRFISYVFTSNVAEMVPFLVYIFLPVPLPLAVIQALAVDIGTDLLPALALGIEPPSRNTLMAPPESPKAPLLTRPLATRTFLFFGVIEALLGLGAFFAFYMNEGWRPGDSFAAYADIAHEATTLTFLAIVGGQVGCLFAQRDGGLRQRFSLSTSTAIRIALVFEIGLAVVLVYLPGLNTVFSMASVPPAWLLVIPISAGILTVLDQLRRAVSRGE